EYYRSELHPGYRQLRILNEGAARMGVRSPFFKLHEATASAATRIGGKPYINYASYNYLGMSGDPVVAQAAKDAIDRYGTSVSASRPEKGELPHHRPLECPLPEVNEVKDGVTLVSGHTTNVSTIRYVFGTRDRSIH